MAMQGKLLKIPVWYSSQIAFSPAKWNLYPLVICFVHPWLYCLLLQSARFPQPPKISIGMCLESSEMYFSLRLSVLQWETSQAISFFSSLSTDEFGRHSSHGLLLRLVWKYDTGMSESLLNDDVRLKTPFRDTKGRIVFLNLSDLKWNQQNAAKPMIAPTSNPLFHPPLVALYFPCYISLNYLHIDLHQCSFFQIRKWCNEM